MAATDEINKIKRCGDDYYKILGVDQDAGDDAIKKAYRKLALRLHPDKCSEDGAEEAFKKVGEAFGVLSDPKKRQVYDQVGAEGLKGGGGGGAGGMDVSPEDIFQAFFGGMEPGGGPFMRGGGGMGPGVQTFRFSTGGPGGGVFHFSTGGPGGGFSSFGGPGGPGGMRQRRRPAAAEREEQEEPEELPAWLKTLQVIAAGLGPLMPLVVVAVMGLGIMLMGTIMQFFIQRAFIIMPILYLTEGRLKGILLAAVVVLAILGVL